MNSNGIQISSLALADIIEPNNTSRAVIYNIALVTCGSLIIAISAQFAIGWTVPITGQTFAVLLIGALFGSRRGVATVLLYLAEGITGFPVFSRGQAGIGVLFGFTGGYLIGFIFAVYFVGLLAERGWDRRVKTTILAMIIGNIVIYSFGLFWLSCLIYLVGKSLDGQNILYFGLYPFVIGDLIKIILAAFLLPTGWKLLKFLNIPGDK